MLPGGVCVVLDYEVDQMTDYVADMAQRVVHPDGQVSPAFRKFVSGLLTSTRLPSTTIILGLNYLARRMHIINYVAKSAIPFKPTDGQVWRMLTIGLLLGSKFLDDNTFQNRSWTEDWLSAIDYQLYVNLDTSKDFQAWIENWEIWREEKNSQRKATLDRLAPLAPIDTNVQRARPYQQPYSSYSKSACRERPNSGFAYHKIPQSAWSTNSYDYPTPQLTPPSAVDSGYNTPEYPSTNGGGPRFNDWSVYQGYSRGPQQSQQQAPYVSTRIATYHTPPYTNHFDHYQNVWEEATECTCRQCMSYQNMKSYRTPQFGYDRMMHGNQQVAV
ncbi:putative meiotically up-regulated gene 80 protein [Calycina marina]|uniref:Meiotically up-regulated gene 80 protein n=1 Tax=Calycina marina TaxID=1763456 RepID=A0A9P7ZA81_9HELO|nr:putative meiotically up-regulated gene 80 protein [Calycina marina]